MTTFSSIFQGKRGTYQYLAAGAIVSGMVVQVELYFLFKRLVFLEKEVTACRQQVVKTVENMHVEVVEIKNLLTTTNSLEDKRVGEQSAYMREQMDVLVRIAGKSAGPDGVAGQW